MWLFEQHGFVSVVAYDPKKDYDKQSPFKKIAKEAGTHLLIRARIKEDLDWIKETVPSLKVETDSAADYAYRCVISRRQFKRALSKAVDEIDYDSHFKEAARDNSPKAEGRYNAMMGVWSKMADLQPIRPWSGAFYSGGYSSRSTYSSGSSVGSLATPKPTGSVSTLAPGAQSMEEFLKDYVESNGETSFRNGGGPRTGFKVGDRVQGYTGAGEVIEVQAKGGSADRVKVKMDKGSTVTIVSNYLMPENLPDLNEADGLDMEYVYDLIRKHIHLSQDSEGEKSLDFPVDLIAHLNDEAFELLTRTQEFIDSGKTLDKVALDEIYDEILWESSSDEERIRIWQDAEGVPAKYEQDAIKIFNSLV